MTYGELKIGDILFNTRSEDIGRICRIDFVHDKLEIALDLLVSGGSADRKLVRLMAFTRTNDRLEDRDDLLLWREENL